MNSANKVTTNRIRKIQSDQWPRLFALKLPHRRALSGESSKLPGSQPRPSGPAGSRSGVNSGAPGLSVSLGTVLASTSHLPRLEIDAGIDPGIGEVGNQIHDQSDQCENIEIGEHDRIVAIEHAFEAQKPKPVERENRLDQQRAGKEG